MELITVDGDFTRIILQRVSLYNRRISPSTWTRSPAAWAKSKKVTLRSKAKNNDVT